MSVLELYHATAHMQVKLVALSLKRGIGIVLSFQNISDQFIYCTTSLPFPLFLSVEIHKISY